MKRILTIVGARPNFIKITQFGKVASNYSDIEVKIVHTGQHYDANMSKVFFKQFDLIPDYFLNVTKSSEITRFSEIMRKLEGIIREYKPHLVIVVGDVNSTFAGSFVAQRMGVKIAHVESGLRSFDRTMPEEINRLLTDQISDELFVTEQSAIDNLKKEGINPENIHFVGNTMIDTLVAFDDKIKGSVIQKDLNLKPGEYILMTMHRPATVDHKEELIKLIGILKRICKTNQLVFPIHPRSMDNILKFDLKARFDSIDNLILTPPLDYFSFQKLIADSKVIITDSGGIQEEATYKKIPCLTLRSNTERPSTTIIGSNKLIALDVDEIENQINDIENNQYKTCHIPPMWDGNATERIFEVLSRIL